ncbi:MAG TPA: NAD(P)-dependent oxidoreductase [Candidatus Margulisiibacteriota bacterium]|nr:NAD(P)-dependent oxidoreductase [Candidatus Margulisiibacteriota bacterium]
MTGGSGWLGTRLLRALAHGLPDVPQFAEPDRARSLRCLLPPAADDAGVRAICDRIVLFRGDLRDRASLEAFCSGADGAILYHCAGVVHPMRWTREFFDVNVEGTRQLLAAAEACGVRRAVVMSSNSPFGLNPGREQRFDEQSPYHPYMGYGRSKMLMERVVAEFQNHGKLETVVVRAPWFYGPSQPARQTVFFSMIRRGSVPIVGDGANLRSMAYVDNLCQGLLLCGQSPGANGETYWIADARPYSMNEIVDTIERLMASEFSIRVSGRRLRLPNVVADVARGIDAVTQRCGLYLQRIHVLSEMNGTIACRIDKARQALGYEPAIELEEGMRRSLQWCIARGLPL